MKIIKRAIKDVYRFECPNCGSVLEADLDEIKPIYGCGTVSEVEFYCPVCDSVRTIFRVDMIRRTVYADKTSEREEEA